MAITGSNKPVDIILSVHIAEEFRDSAKEYLKQCLSSIIQFTPRDLYDIICVIDRGWDGTEEFLSEYKSKGWIRSIFQNTTTRGYTRTNNIGLEESQAEFALLLNLDTVVSPGWLEGLLDCGRRTGAAVIGCKLIDEYGRINHAGAYGIGYHRGMNEENIGYFQEEEVEWVTGACFMISKKAREVLGNLNEYYPHWGSDREYCKEAWTHGFKVMYSPVEILHYTEKSNSEEVKNLFKDSPR